MPKPTILLSVPGLREKDVAAMPQLRRLTAGGELAELIPSFPCVTCTVQANMTTGKLPAQHGIIANGFYWRDRQQVEMWTSPNDCIAQPQIWDLLSHQPDGPRSAVWFPLHAKGCEADYVCTPAPIHNPDGSESLWCYTRPQELYGQLQDQLDHFPLKHFWGPLSNIQGSAWIAASAVHAANRFQPELFYIYLPHLDYAAQRTGPDSSPALKAVAELDDVIGRLGDALTEAYDNELLWLVVGEYSITPVDHVTYPNRLLREAGLLVVLKTDEGEQLDLQKSRAWAMVDHQFSHVFLADNDPQLSTKVADLFRHQQGIAEVLVGEQRTRYALDHPRSGEIILISTHNSWQAYYWWFDDAEAPLFARSVDIHQKPGYDPVELYVDPTTKTIPLDPTLINGSHGAPALDSTQRTVIVASDPLMFPEQPLADTDVCDIVMKHFGIATQ